jgi:uncharacterized protein YyaL (SSP411 family)
VTLADALDIAFDRVVATSVREKYWAAASTWRELRRLQAPGNRLFRRHAQRDLARYVFGRARPVSGENERRARAAADWLLRAQRATSDDGVSLGYFPCSSDGIRWRPSYPETTGYIISSLLSFADRYGDARARNCAIRMARWEADIQMRSGAVQGGPVVAAHRQTAAAFNTGMVLDGWCSAYALTRDADLLVAARRAADFLIDDLDDAGYYRTNGAFVKSGEIKTYTCLCAWALHRFGDLVDDARYRDAALRSAEAALRQQRPNGWFAHNCLTRSDAPLTHTLGYTLQGILEVGVAAQRDEFVKAVELSMNMLVRAIAANGFLPGMFFDDWKPATFSSCLTGSAQLAIVGYRLSAIVGRSEYRVAADRLVDFLKCLQALDAEDENVNGALAGSFPLFGGYMRGGYPNWATKYLLDALMLQSDQPAQPSSQPE